MLYRSAGAFGASGIEPEPLISIRTAAVVTMALYVSWPVKTLNCDRRSGVHPSRPTVDEWSPNCLPCPLPHGVKRGPYGVDRDACRLSCTCCSISSMASRSASLFRAVSQLRCLAYHSQALPMMVRVLLRRYPTLPLPVK